jgi:hypothetical protein
VSRTRKRLVPAWLTLAILIFAVSVITGQANGLDSEERCPLPTRAGVSYGSTTSHWPPGERCVYIDSEGRTVDDDTIIGPPVGMLLVVGVVSAILALVLVGAGAATLSSRAVRHQE